MLTEPVIAAEIHPTLRAPRLRTVTMLIRINVLMPAIETHIVLITIIPAAAADPAATAAVAVGDDVDVASGGIVDGEIRGGLAVNVDGAGVV